MDDFWSANVADLYKASEGAVEDTKER